MSKISIDKAQPGMVVIEKVANDKGMVLLPTGTTLNEALIARLKKWGVQNINIQSEGEEAGSAQGSGVPKMSPELEKRLEEKFKPVLDDPIMATIYSAVKAYYQNDA